MATISGKYVKTFAEASHALPQGMHMNADYPFMLPRIVKLANGNVTLKSESFGIDDAVATVKLKGDQELCHVTQSSSFERMTGQKGTRFTFMPFKDCHTDPIGGE